MISSEFSEKCMRNEREKCHNKLARKNFMFIEAVRWALKMTAKKRRQKTNQWSDSEHCIYANSWANIFPGDLPCLRAKLKWLQVWAKAMQKQRRAMTTTTTTGSTRVGDSCDFGFLVGLNVSADFSTSSMEFRSIRVAREQWASSKIVVLGELQFRLLMAQ